MILIHNFFVFDTKFIIFALLGQLQLFTAKFIILNTKLLVFDTPFLVFEKQFITFAHADLRRPVHRSLQNSSWLIHNSSVLIHNSSFLLTGGYHKCVTPQRLFDLLVVPIRPILTRHLVYHILLLHVRACSNDRVMWKQVGAYSIDCLPSVLRARESLKDRYCNVGADGRELQYNMPAIDGSV